MIPDIDSIVIIAVFLLASVMLAFAVDNCKKYKGSTKTVFFICSSFCMVLFSTVRYGIGTDYFTYKEEYFQRIKVLYTSDFMLTVLSVINYYMLDNFIGFILMTSLVTHLSVNYTMYKLSRYYALSIYLYISMWYFFMSWNLIRQYLAMSLILIAVMFLSNRKWIISLAFCLMAILFHSSALIAILIIALFYYSNKLLYAVCILIALLAYLYYDNIFAIAISFIDFHYIHYLFIEQQINYTAVIFSLMAVFPFLYFLISKRYTLTRETILYWKLYLFGTVLLLYSTKNLYFTRFAYYFLVFQVFMIPNTISIIKKDIIRYALFAYFILYGIASIAASFIQHRDGVIPLKFIFGVN